MSGNGADIGQVVAMLGDVLAAQQRMQAGLDEVRAEGLPLVTRVPSLPALDPGTRVRLQVGQMDFLERTVSLLYRETLGTGTAAVADDLFSPS